jgi:hypothetical protein
MATPTRHRERVDPLRLLREHEEDDAPQPKIIQSHDIRPLPIIGICRRK